MTGEKRSARRNTRTSDTFIITKPTWMGVGLRPGLRTEREQGGGTNSHSHSTTQNQSNT